MGRPLAAMMNSASSSLSVTVKEVQQHRQVTADIALPDRE